MTRASTRKSPPTPPPASTPATRPASKPDKGKRKARNGTTGPKQVDWGQIKLRFFTGDVDPSQPITRLPKLITLVELAAKVGLSADAVERRSAEEGWIEERKAWRAKLHERILEETNAALASDHVTFRKDQHLFARALLTKAAQKLQSEALSATDLRAVGATGREAQRIGEVAVGLPADGPQQATVFAWIELGAGTEPDAVTIVGQLVGDEEDL